MSTQGHNIQDQRSRLDRAVEDLSRCVRALEPELFTTLLGGWSPRDIVAHLVGWNGYMVEGGEQIRQGELPFFDVDPGEDYCKVNAELVAAHSSTDREELLAELRTSAAKLGAYLGSLDSDDWSRDYGVRHDGESITIRESVDEMIADYAHHQQQIEEWQRARH